LALFSNLWLAVVMLALAGAGNMLFLIPSVTLVQQLTPDESLGRVFSIRGILSSFASIASNALVGVAAEQLGVQSMVGVIGGLLILLGLLAFLLPSARNTD
jgi:MFS family permease